MTRDELLESVYEALVQAQDCINGETPEDINCAEATADTISKIRDAMLTVEALTAWDSSPPAQTSCPWDVALGDRVMQLEAAGADKLSISAILGLIAFVRDGEGSAAPSTSRAIERETIGAILRIIDDLDAYQKRPGNGDWGVECICCRGELFDKSDREVIDAARALSMVSGPTPHE